MASLQLPVKYLQFPDWPEQDPHVAYTHSIIAICKVQVFTDLFFLNVGGPRLALWHKQVVQPTQPTTELSKVNERDQIYPSQTLPHINDSVKKAERDLRSHKQLQPGFMLIFKMTQIILTAIETFQMSVFSKYAILKPESIVFPG